MKPPSSPLQAPPEAPFNAEGLKPLSSPLEAPLKPPSSPLEASFKVKPPSSPLEAPLKPPSSLQTFVPRLPCAQTLQAPLKGASEGGTSEPAPSCPRNQEKKTGCRSIRVAMVAKVICPMLVIITWCQLGNQVSLLVARRCIRVLLPTSGCFIFGHLILWPTILKRIYIRSCRTQTHTCSSTSASIEKINACMDPNLQLQTGLPSTFSQIALNDKGGESLDKETIFSSQGTVPSRTKRLHYDIIDYMLLKMY